MAVGGYRRTPYRGASGNIAFRRDKFFDNKGFSSSLNLRSGDDDIFINEFTDAPTPWWSFRPSHYPVEYLQLPRVDNAPPPLHEFTGRYVPHGRRVLMATGEVMSPRL